MNRNQMILLLLVLAIIGSAGLILVKRNKESWDVPETRMGDKVLPNFQPNEVAAIHIKGGSELTLARKNDLWRVQERNDYPANFHQISDVLIKLKDLKVVEADTATEPDLPRVNLGPPGTEGGGTLVEFKDAQGKVLDSLLIGKKHLRAETDSRALVGNGEPDGCYVLLPNDPRDVLLISEPLGSLQANAASWLDKDFVKVEKVSSISVAPPGASNAWKISRESETAPWVLADAQPGEILDATAAARAASVLASPRFVDVAINTSPAETGLDKAVLITEETFDHFTYAFKVGAKAPDGNYYLTVAASADLSKTADKKLQDKLKLEQGLAGSVYFFGSWIIEPVLRERAQMMEGYVEPPAGEPAKPAPVPDRSSNSLDSGWKPRVIQ